MNINKFSAGATLALLSALGAFVAPAAHAGSVTVNSTLTCTDSPTISMTPSGDLSITCTPVAGGGGTPASPPTCNVIPASGTVSAGGNLTVSASCSPGATSYSWATSSGAPAIVGAGGSLNFPTEGSYTFQVTGTNTAGTGAISTASTITVTPAGTGGGGASGCPTPSSLVQVLNNNPVIGTVIWPSGIAIPRGAVVSLPLPVATLAGKAIGIKTAQVAGQDTTMKALMSIAPCPGDFTSGPTTCVAWGSVYQGALRMSLPSVTTQTAACQVEVGKQYYVNVKNVEFDRVTPSCKTAVCLLFLVNTTN